MEKSGAENRSRDKGCGKGRVDRSLSESESESRSEKCEDRRVLVSKSAKMLFVEEEDMVVVCGRGHVEIDLRWRENRSTGLVLRGMPSHGIRSQSLRQLIQSSETKHDFEHEIPYKSIFYRYNPNTAIYSIHNH